MFSGHCTEAAETESCAEVSSTTSSTLLLRCQEGEVTSEEREFEDGQKIDGEATGMLVALPRVLSASTATTAEAIEASTKHSKLMIWQFCAIWHKISKKKIFFLKFYVKSHKIS